MTKTQAIKAFGTITALAKAIGYSRQAVYLWPEKLPSRVENTVKAQLTLRMKLHRSPRTNGI